MKDYINQVKEKLQQLFLKITDKAGKGKKKKQLLTVYLALAAVVLVVLAVSLGLAFSGGKKEVSATAESETYTEETGTEAEETDLEEGSETDESTEAETETEPEEIYVELTDANTEGFVTVEGCEIAAGTGNFVFSGTVENKPVSDDDNFYLLEMAVYETEIVQDRAPIATTAKKTEFSFTAAVNENRADSRLYSKYVAAVKLNGSYVALCAPQYITNPEAVAAYTAAFPETASKKGLLVDPIKLHGSELDDLGVKHATYNIPVGRILGETTDGRFPTIYYSYNGRTYAFNGRVIDEYDFVFRTLTNKGIQVTAILLNNGSGAYPYITHPLSRGGSCSYYAFNAADKDGVELLAAVGSFLSQRYRDNTHGKVMSWIIGNEVNVRTDWNYMEAVDLETYTREYGNAVRVFYNSIKSMNANAKVYVCMDQQWNRNINNNANYDGRDMLDVMNRHYKEEGNIDWGLAIHPYAFPLTKTDFWNMSGKNASLVIDSVDSSIVTMKNIHVVTDYLQRSEFLTDNGEVRSVILSEMGYSSTNGEALQATALAYSYYIAAANQHIDAIMLTRQDDAAEEVAQGLALGLCDQGDRRKYAYNVYKHLDTPEADSVTAFAREMLGISSWNQIITQR